MSEIHLHLAVMLVPAVTVADFWPLPDEPALLQAKFYGKRKKECELCAANGITLADTDKMLGYH